MKYGIITYTLIAIVVSFVLMVAGCAFDPSTGTVTHTNVKQYDVNGRTVTCILITNTKGTATLDCDWAHAK